MEALTKNDRFQEEVNNIGLYKHLKELARVSFKILAQHLERGEQIPVKLSEKISIENTQSHEITKRFEQDHSYFLFNHFEEIEQTVEISSCIDFMMRDDIIRKHFPIGPNGKRIGGPTFLRSSYIFPFLSNFSEEMRGFVFDLNIFDKVYKEFENYFYKTETKILKFSPIQNLDCELEEIELKGGMKIRKISKKELECLWSAVNNIGPVDRNEILKLKFALEMRCVINEETLVTTTNPSELSHKVVIALRLFKEGQIWPCFIFSKPLTWLPHSGKWSFGGGLSSRGFHEEYLLTKDEAKKIESFWEKFCSFDLTKHSFLNVALNRFNYAYERNTPEDILIDCMIAFEALYSEGPGDLSYKVSTRIARLLKEDPAEREDMSLFMKKNYGIISTIVHGDEISKKSLKKISELLGIANADKNVVLRKAASETEKYLRDSIKAFLILNRKQEDISKILDFDEKKLIDEKAKLNQSGLFNLSTEKPA